MTPAEFRKMRKGKSHTNAQKTGVDGIQFQSKLEVYAYTALSRARIKANYEKDSYLLIEGFTASAEVWTMNKGVFRGRNSKVRPITYKPDFTCPDGNWIIEVKGRKFADFMMRWKLFLRYLYLNNLNPSVYMVSTQKEIDIVVRDILDRYK